MRKLTLAAVVAVLLAATAPVMTVTNGRPDGNGHPYVGIALQPAAGGGFFVCSGSFISPTRFLTAAHCFDPALPVLVSPANQQPFPVVTGVVHNDPNWCLGCGSGLQGADTHDVAVITLNGAVILPQYAALPAPGIVDTLTMKTPVDLVGYGVQGFIRGGGKPEQIFTAIRYFAPSELVQSNNRASAEFIKLTANPSKGTGGVCFGDSGGPDILGGTNIVLAVNSYVTNGNCSGVTYSQRVDLPDILAFINSF
jgi:hypothetical protein